MRYLIILLCLLQCSAYSTVLIDKRIYVKLDGKFNLKFNYPVNHKDDSKNRLSSHSSVKCLCLQHIAKDTKIGFQVGISDILRSNILEKMKVKEGYFILKNQRFGSFEYGKRELVSQSMLINTSKFNIAAGGINSDWKNYVNFSQLSKGVMNPGSDLKLESWKVISYISPEINRFQLGFSYENDENLIGGAITYKNSFTDNISLAAAITGEFVQQNESNDKIKHWHCGLHIKYSKLSCILSYGHIDERSTHYTNAGVAYHSGFNKLSLTYFSSINNYGENKLSSYALGLERPLVMGISYYFDIVRFNTKEPTGYVLLIGLKLNF